MSSCHLMLINSHSQATAGWQAATFILGSRDWFLQISVTNGIRLVSPKRRFSSRTWTDKIPFGSLAEQEKSLTWPKLSFGSAGFCWLFFLVKLLGLQNTSLPRMAGQVCFLFACSAIVLKLQCKQSMLFFFFFSKLEQIANFIDSVMFVKGS